MPCYVRTTIRRAIRAGNEIANRLTQRQVTDIDTKVKEILRRDGYLRPEDEKKHTATDEALGKYMKEKGPNNEIKKYLEDYFSKAQAGSGGGGPPSPFGQLEDPRRRRRQMEEILAEEEQQQILAMPPQ